MARKITIGARVDQHAARQAVPTMREIRDANPDFFAPGNDAAYGTRKWRKSGWLIWSDWERDGHRGRAHYFADPENGLALSYVHLNWGGLGDGPSFLRHTPRRIERVGVDIETGWMTGVRYVHDPHTMEFTKPIGDE